VTVLALLVPSGCSGLLGFVAAAASGLFGTAMWFVATDALRVAFVGFVVFSRVARRTTHTECCGAVGQTAVATFALLVAFVRFDLRQLLSVTRLASGAIGRGLHELVGLVALLALGAVVKALLVRRGLVTAAALPRRAVCGARRGVRRVASDTSAGHPVLRVVRVNVLVTP
jgi:hypothetical protein